MATWTNVPNTSLDVGKAARSVDIKAIRDNITALAEGASGAPRLETAAYTDESVTTAKIADANVTTAKLESSERMTTNNVLGQVAGAALNAVGSYRIAFYDNATALSPGDTTSGSNIGGGGGTRDNFITILSFGGISSLSGTWRYMGHNSIAEDDGDIPPGLFLRIS